MSKKDDQAKRLVQAYDDMLEGIKEIIHSGKATQQDFKFKLDYAREKVHDLGELTREEIEHIADYLQRDIHAAADYLVDTEQQLRDWLNFDLQLAEDRMAGLFAEVVDQRRVELQQMEQQLSQWHSGEISGIGSLECINCSEILHFKTTSQIPACPKCDGKVFNKGFGL